MQEQMRKRARLGIACFMVRISVCAQRPRCCARAYEYNARSQEALRLTLVKSTARLETHVPALEVGQVAQHAEPGEQAGHAEHQTRRLEQAQRGHLCAERSRATWTRALAASPWQRAVHHASRTLISHSVFSTVPATASRSLITMSTYQPLKNTIASSPDSG